MSDEKRLTARPVEALKAAVEAAVSLWFTGVAGAIRDEMQTDIDALTEALERTTAERDTCRDRLARYRQRFGELEES